MADLIHKYSSRLETSIRLLDVLMLWATGMLCGFWRFSGPLSDAAPVHNIVLYFSCALAFLLFHQFNLYGSWRGRSMPLMFFHLAAAWATVLILALLFSFLIHRVGSLSRLWLFYWYVSGLLAMALVRVGVYSTLRAMRRKGLNSKRVVIVGYGPAGQEMHRRAAQQSWYGYDVKAVHADQEYGAGQIGPDIDRIEALDDIHDYVTRKRIHEIWITLPLSASQQLQTLQYLLRNTLVDVRWMPDTVSMHILSNRLITFLGMPTVELNQPVSNDVRGIIKDIFDRLFAVCALILLAPLMLAITIGIKLTSPGPILFRQPRLGLNGKPFEVYKFRSMRVHQEHGAVTQATRNDARITRFGAFLRRTSLDELPQFFNVLRGDMSVVGPRPHALEHNDLYQHKLEVYMLRHRVKPGITGWAQINGFRGETDTVDKMARRVEFDLDYIENWTFWMDIKIIAWTAFRGWTGNNAY